MREGRSPSSWWWYGSKQPMIIKGRGRPTLEHPFLFLPHKDVSSEICFAIVARPYGKKIRCCLITIKRISLPLLQWPLLFLGDGEHVFLGRMRRGWQVRKWELELLFLTKHLNARWRVFPEIYLFESRRTHRHRWVTATKYYLGSRKGGWMDGWIDGAEMRHRMVQTFIIICPFFGCIQSSASGFEIRLWRSIKK